MNKESLIEVLKKALASAEDRDGCIKEFQQRAADDAELETYNIKDAELLAELAYDLEFYVYGEDSSYSGNEKLLEEIDKVVKQVKK